MKRKMVEALEANNFMVGRLLAASKNDYCRKHSHNTIIFNSNLISKNLNGKFWHGDIDLTLDAKLLRKLARKFDDVWYIVDEHSGRNKNLTGNEAEEAALYIID